jgi:hypothetical protein
MLPDNDLRSNPSAAPVFAWLSAPGVAALSLLFISAPDTQVFHGDLAKVTNLPRRVWLRDSLGNPVDEVMACRERGGILLTCHGGPAVRRALEAELTRAGFQAAAPTPFGHTHFETATLGLLPDAQGDGAVGLLLEAAGRGPALAELLDSPERIAPLLAESAGARYLLEPPRVQLWGPVNAGKSSLLNALCGRTLAAVGQEPGLTRDVIEGRLEHQGFTIRLFDAPGVWAGGTALDAAAQQLAHAWRQQADLTVELSPTPGAPRPWLLHSRADEQPAGAVPRVSVHEPATLRELKDRLIEHFFGPLRRLPPERRLALHPGLRADLAELAHGRQTADGLRAKWLD